MSIPEYLGLDYFAAVTAVAGMYCLGNRNPWGFVLYALSSAAMIGFAGLVGSWPILAANLIALAVTLRGLWKWRRDGHGAQA
jgi:hypothetical protein